MSALRVALLGSPVVERGGLRVTFDTRKATALLAYLAVTGHPHSRETLGGLLWPAQDPTLARGALRRTLSVLNSATGGDVLTVDRSSVGIRRDGPFELDVDAFRTHAAAQGANAAAELEAATILYRDDFLAGFSLRDSPEFDEWQAFQSDGLRQQLAVVLERLVRTRVSSHELDAATEAARRWLALDPLNEPAHAMLMRLYAWTGQRGAALRQYRECVRVLAGELGVPPLTQTTALDDAIRTGHLDQPEPVERDTAPVVAVRGAAVPLHPLVGRDRELALITAARASGGGGRLVVLSGEAGIGKSRLLAELQVAAGGGPVVTTRCHEGESGLAFGVISELLRAALRARPAAFAGLPQATKIEVGRLLPDLAPALTPPPALDSPGAQSRFRGALLSTLTAALGEDCGPSMPLVAVEDLHWADESSADVLAYVVRRLRDVPMLLLLTWRGEALPRRWPIHAALSAALADGVATPIDLGRLDHEAVAALATAVLEAPLPSGDVERLCQETGGLPLLATEYLEAFRRDGRAADGAPWQLPRGVRDLFQARLAGLGEMTAQVLAAGAVLNGEMTPALVRATSGRGQEEVVSALEEAVYRGVLVETDRGGGRYEFSHDAMRRVVYDQVSLARRRLLHSRAADALGQSPEGAAATVAAHLRGAGRDAESAEWSWRAALQARGLYAHNQALEHLADAAALGYTGHLVQRATGEALTALGRYREALLAYEHAAATCPATDRLALATLEHRLADVHHRLGAWGVADSHLAAALELLAVGGDPALHARVLADISLVAHRRGDAAAASEAATRALEQAAAARDDAALAQAHDVLGVLACDRGEYELAEQHLRASLDHAVRLADPSQRVAALNNLALLRAAAGSPGDALADAREALQLGLEHGDRHRAAALHTNLADLLHATGQQAEAREHLTSAARLFAGVDDEELRRPEIWKLARW